MNVTLERNITIGIKEEVDFVLQLMMWHLVDELKVRADYLQVFKLKKGEDGITIEHSQEVPKYKKIYKVNLENLLFNTDFLKVYVINTNNEYLTMMKAEEY